MHQTNWYSVQKKSEICNTNVDEMKALIGIEILMEIIKLPS